MDMEAGIEHLGRGTAASMDAFLVVVEPSQKSLQTAGSVMNLAQDVGVTRIFAVPNKVRTEEEERWLKDQITELPILGLVTYNEHVIEADISGVPAYLFDKSFAGEIKKIKENLRTKLASDHDFK